MNIFGMAIFLKISALGNYRCEKPLRKSFWRKVFATLYSIYLKWNAMKRVVKVSQQNPVVKTSNRMRQICAPSALHIRRHLTSDSGQNFRLSMTSDTYCVTFISNNTSAFLLHRIPLPAINPSIQWKSAVSFGIFR